MGLVDNFTDNLEYQEVWRSLTFQYVQVKHLSYARICRIVHPEMKNASSFIHASCLRKLICLFFFCGRQNMFIAEHPSCFATHIWICGW